MTAGVNARLPAIAVKLKGVMDAMKPSRGLKMIEGSQRLLVK